MTDRPKLLSHLPRFAAEFLVIVVGVLVALTVDEYRSTLEERQRVDGYLEQLRTELGYQQKAAEALSREATLASENGAALLAALGDPQAHPDTMTQWFGTLLRGEAKLPLPIGLQSLTSTGDLRLIDDRGLREQLMRFRAVSDSRAAETSSLAEYMLDAFWRVGGLADVSILARGRVDGVSDGVIEWDWPALARNPAFRSAIYDLFNVARNRMGVEENFSVVLQETIDALDLQGT